MTKEIRRGYVKWTDEDGVFHKEPLHEHPELLAQASAAEQIAAEEARRLNEAAEEYLESRDDHVEEDQLNTLEALQEAPDDVLTASELVAVADEDGNEIIVPFNEVAEPISSADMIENERAAPAQETIVGTDEADSTPLVRETPLPKELWSEDHEEALEQLREETT